MITWPEFLVGFVVVSAIALYLRRSLFRRQWRRLGQTLLFISVTCLLLDYPAETRELWWFPVRSGVEILETPIENHFFIATCATDLLIVYLSLKRHHHGTTAAREHQP